MDVSAFWYHHPAFDQMGFILENHQFLSKYIGPGFSLQRGTKFKEVFKLLLYNIYMV